MYVKRFPTAEGQLEKAIDGFDASSVVGIVIDGPGSVLIFTKDEPPPDVPVSKRKAGAKETR